MKALKEIFEVFKSRQKIFQIGLCALIFLGMAVPFKVMVLIPGLTEVRPVNAIPIVAGLLLGPAGAWGCAIGNLIADLFGTFSIASLFGFIGNFTAAYLPYKIWHMRGKGETPNVKTNKNLGRFILMAAIASLSVAVILCFGLDFLDMAWGKNLLMIVFWNDFGFSLFLGLPVFIVLTSDQVNFRINVPETISKSKNSQVYQRLLLSLLTASGILFSYGVYTGMRLAQSPVMAASSLVFGISLIAIIVRR